MWDFPIYQKLAEEEGVSDRCFWIKRVESEELPLWYSWCDCFCTPSRWEGFGYVFIEAAACEAAVITSNIRPMNEYLTDKKNAILVDEYENPEIIANAINSVLENNDEIKKMRKNARDVGIAFGKDSIDQIEISIYEKMFNIVPNEKNNALLRKTLKKNSIMNVIYLFSKKTKLVVFYHLLKKLINKIMFFFNNIFYTKKKNEFLSYKDD